MNTTYQDPLSAPFWDAAAQHRLVIQRCRTCGRHQFFPRPFCIDCQSDDVDWIDARGTGTIYSMTTVRLEIDPAMPPPYVVALVELDEGPRLLTNVALPCAIGDRVEVAWRARDGAPPVPVFGTI